MKRTIAMGGFNIKKNIVLLVFVCTVFFANTVHCQTKFYRPFTKWYQDPFGFKPLELSVATGFIWGSSAAIAGLLFTKKDTGLLKKVSFFQETGYSFGYKPPYTGVLQNETGVLFAMRKWLSLGIGIDLFHFKDKINNTMAVGFRPLARWYPLRSKQAGLFFEYGAGASYAMRRFPLTGTGLEADTARTGTRFNFLSKYGIGAMVSLGDRFSIEAGARHFHLSNGNIKGIDRNPSHDSNGFFIGLVYSVKEKQKN